MGFSYSEMLEMTWIEFDYYSTGYQKRIERELNNTRIIVSSMANMWGKNRVKPTDIMQLSIDDIEYDRGDLMTMEQANEMLRKHNGSNK